MVYKTSRSRSEREDMVSAWDGGVRVLTTCAEWPCWLVRVRGSFWMASLVTYAQAEWSSSEGMFL